MALQADVVEVFTLLLLLLLLWLLLLWWLLYHHHTISPIFMHTRDNFSTIRVAAPVVVAMTIGEVLIAIEEQ